MPITALPTPPSRNDPANFAERGDAFMAALPVFVAEANALETNVNQKEASASQSAQTATTKAGEAGVSATAAGQHKQAAEAAAIAADGYADQAATEAYSASQHKIAAEQAAAVATERAASIDPATLVRNTGNETIAGVKTFSSSPVAPTPAADDASTKTATTAFVIGQAAGATPMASNANGAAGTSTRFSRGDHQHPYPSQLSTASGSAPSYAARAWVNFNGTGTVAIRASGNVSSITDNGVGDYTINFTTAMPDANYCVVGAASAGANTQHVLRVNTVSAPATGSVRVGVTTMSSGSPAVADSDYCNVSIFR